MKSLLRTDDNGGRAALSLGILTSGRSGLVEDRRFSVYREAVLRRAPGGHIIWSQAANINLLHRSGAGTDLGTQGRDVCDMYIVRLDQNNVWLCSRVSRLERRLCHRRLNGFDRHDLFAVEDDPFSRRKSNGMRGGVYSGRVVAFPLLEGKLIFCKCLLDELVEALLDLLSLGRDQFIGILEHGVVGLCVVGDHRSNQRETEAKLNLRIHK